ncbi:MAG: FAD-dependent protein, partial [Nitrospirota bacterium]
MKYYNVIIVGAGPSGIFSALELLKSKKDIRILIIERGEDINDRVCPLKIRDISCVHCDLCSILSGWGGAGAFSDGKLNLSPEIGGFLSRYIEKEKLSELIEYVDAIYKEHGAPDRIYGKDLRRINELKRLAQKYDLLLIPSYIRHVGTENCFDLLKSFREEINKNAEVLFNQKVEEVILKDRKAAGVRTSDGNEFYSDYTILAPGRAGSDWLSKEAARLNLTSLNNPVDIGVRVEVPASILEHITSLLYEPKFIFYSKKFDDKVRTFCMNPYGEVVKEFSQGISTVNGHSYSEKKTFNTNFAILVSTLFTEPFNEPISYGAYIARLANFLGRGVLIQRLGDLQRGRRSTPDRIAKGVVSPTLEDATPGDLSFVLPYRYLSNILEMLETLDRIAPGINSTHT